MAPRQSVRRVVRAAAVCAQAAAFCVGAASLTGATLAQQLIGYVKADDADVTGATDVMDGQAVLAGSVGVTAKGHTAVITLGRGGLARVCQTSALHMTESKETEAASKSSAGASAAGEANANAGYGTAAPLLFSLERGAVEIRMNGLLVDACISSYCSTMSNISPSTA